MGWLHYCSFFFTGFSKRKACLHCQMTKHLIYFSPSKENNFRRGKCCQAVTCKAGQLIVCPFMFGPPLLGVSRGSAPSRSRHEHSGDNLRSELFSGGSDIAGCCDCSVLSLALTKALTKIHTSALSGLLRYLRSSV